MKPVGNTQNYLGRAAAINDARTAGHNARHRLRITYCSFLLFAFGALCLTASADESVTMQVEFDIFPGAEQRSATYFDFEQYDLVLATPTKGQDGYKSEKIKPLEGRIQRQNYFIDGNSSSPLEVFTNYREALLGKGFEILFECQRLDCGNNPSTWSKPLKNTMATNVDQEQQFYLAAALGAPQTYVAIFIKGQYGGAGIEYMFDQIEPKAMATGRVAISIDDMMASLDRTGKVAIYDIFFATGKASLTTNSTPVLADIATLLHKRPTVSLYVVGHTDDTGSLELNRTLSQRRAQAVVADLIGRGVAAARLTAFGAGPFAPAATNRNDTGRATNRRVELVERLP